MLGRRIASLRRKAGLSQAELAERLGVSPSAVGMYEQGRREPSCDILIALAREFRVSLDYLLTGQLALGPAPGVKSFLADSRGLTKEDLIILLAAQIIGEM